MTVRNIRSININSKNTEGHTEWIYTQRVLFTCTVSTYRPCGYVDGKCNKKLHPCTNAL